MTSLQALFIVLAFTTTSSAFAESESTKCDYTITESVEWTDIQAITNLESNDTVCISSYGGSAIYAKYGIRAIKQKNLNTVCLDSCGSLGAVLYLAGNTHIGQRQATLLIHAPGSDQTDGSRVINTSNYYKNMFQYVGIKVLLSKVQWDAMWELGETIEIEVKE